MTLPYEHYIAMNNTREFLFSLLDPQQTKVPLAIRKKARQLLKHYPMECDAHDMVRANVEWIDGFNRNMRQPDPVQYSPRDGGWVFWDHTWSEPSKSYLTRRDAEEALQSYIAELNNDAKDMTNAVTDEAIGKVHYMEDPNGPTGPWMP
jgi:hypothetical protein